MAVSPSASADSTVIWAFAWPRGVSCDQEQVIDWLRPRIGRLGKICEANGEVLTHCRTSIAQPLETRGVGRNGTKRLVR